MLHYEQARRLLLEAVGPVETEGIPLAACGGRVLARTLYAREDVPPFDRSAYDGYALRSADTADGAVTLRILEELPAGAVPGQALRAGTAVKILTGAPIPPGADAVVMHERTRFTAESVTLSGPVRPGSGIVRAGEDICRGQLLAPAGSVIDPALAGALAAQGIGTPPVCRRPQVALLSTGSELVEPEESLRPGYIRNAGAAMLETALGQLGCRTLYLGAVPDRAGDIAALLERGLDACDAVICTGGVSAGDYDLTPAAMELCGAELLFRGVDMKPGMACAYARRDGKLLCGLSGNPASALTNFYAVALPALKRLTGRSDCLPREISMALANDFEKSSPRTRLLRGRLLLDSGTVQIELPRGQGNAQLSSAVGCDAMAVVPAGSGPVRAGTVLKGFML